MRYTRWAGMTFDGDVAAAMRLVPLARSVLGELVNSVELSGIDFGVRVKPFPDGVVITARYMDGIASFNISVPPTPEASQENQGDGFVLSPFNGTEPNISVAPFYQSTLLVINGDSYRNNYPDEAHHWFTGSNSGDYTLLGGEFDNNGLLQGNLHWRSKLDKKFHLSWLGNPSSPITYFTAQFQSAYTTGEYVVKLAPTTADHLESGHVFNWDTSDVFSIWLAASFSQLLEPSNGTGVNVAILYKGRVVKPVYDLLKPTVPTAKRNCILGAGGITETDKKRTLYFVSRSFEQQLSIHPLTQSESVYSLNLSDPMATPVLLGTRDITTTGDYLTAVSVDPIPLHGYYFNETTKQFVCLAAQVTTKATGDVSTLPDFQQHAMYVSTGRATWQITDGAAVFAFDTSVNIASSFTQTPVWKEEDHTTFTDVGDPFGRVVSASSTTASFKYAMDKAVVGITDLGKVTTTAIVQSNQADTFLGSGRYVTDIGFQNQAATISRSASVSQQLAFGAHNADVLEFEQTSEFSETTNYSDDFTTVTQKVSDATTFSQHGLDFLYFSLADNLFAYLEYQLDWSCVSLQDFGPISVHDVAPEPVVTRTITNYRGRYVVESAAGAKRTDWFDMTAGGQINMPLGPHNLYAFMGTPVIQLTQANGNPGKDGNETVTTDTDTTYIAEHDYGNKLSLFELTSLISFSLYNVQQFNGTILFTGVPGRSMACSEVDGTYPFAARHPGGWAINKKNLCFSQIGPVTRDVTGATMTQASFNFLTNGNLDARTGATGNPHAFYPLSYIEKREILALGQT